MHATCLVIVPKEIAIGEASSDGEQLKKNLGILFDEDGIEAYVEKQMEPFSEYLEMVEYKQHMDEHDLKMMKDTYKTDNLEELVKKMEDWNGREGGVDEEGLYYLTTSNPDGHWDYYNIGGRWDGLIQGELRPSKDNGFNFDEEHHQLKYNIAKIDSLSPKEVERSIHSVITPEGEWVESEIFDMASMKFIPNKEEVLETIKKYKDCYGVLVDYHH